MTAAPPARSARVFVGRLSRNVIKDHVVEIFSTYGVVRSAEMPMDTIHPMFNKGFAYVDYEQPEDAEKACKFMDGGQIDGQEVKVSKRMSSFAVAVVIFALIMCVTFQGEHLAAVTAQHVQQQLARSAQRFES